MKGFIHKDNISTEIDNKNIEDESELAKDENNLVYWSAGATDPILAKTKKKNNITKF